MTPAVRQQLLGEAKFMRAFFYFYLTNMYGNVPLATSTDWNINSLLSNMPSQQIYQQIITDLKDAESILSTNYLDGTLLNSISDRVRPTKWAAAALLARAYLFSGDYANAESTASVLINNTSLFTLSTSLNDVFLANSKGVYLAITADFSGA
ncbi:RagB/SusD family nutrient uptake outer membrane protein [Puia sp. P3]|uniref:RagB/SusD family nutrient uptake outer membrane protein n=1 Tax=Puia sp. P3 TaxID=3423952 RepID=UPI003D67D469